MDNDGAADGGIRTSQLEAPVLEGLHALAALEVADLPGQVTHGTVGRAAGAVGVIVWVGPLLQGVEHRAEFVVAAREVAEQAVTDWVLVDGPPEVLEDVLPREPAQPCRDGGGIVEAVLGEGDGALYPVHLEVGSHAIDKLVVIACECVLCGDASYMEYVCLCV